MTDKVKKSIFVRLRNYFITGAIVLIPIGITIYLTLIMFLGIGILNSYIYYNGSNCKDVLNWW